MCRRLPREEAGSLGEWSRDSGVVKGRRRSGSGRAEAVVSAERLGPGEADSGGVSWRCWGPYLSERQGGTVREAEFPYADQAWMLDEEEFLGPLFRGALAERLRARIRDAPRTRPAGGRR